MEILVFVVIAFVAGAAGIALGMLAAPSIGRLADRVGRSDDEDGAGIEDEEDHER